MANRSRALLDASRLSSRLLQMLIDELRHARVALGLTQLDVARELGVSRTFVCRLENLRVRTTTVDYIVRHAAVVGLRPSIKLFPLGGALRDAAQARYIARFIERIGHVWRVRLEAAIPLPGDLRAIDVLLEGACVVAVEVISRLGDLQAQLRAAELKKRDFGAARLILVVAGTHANRRALAEARSTLLATFELDSRRVMASLAAGEDPGRDAVVVLE